MKVLGIITARSGSKGLPNKNIKLLNGKPMISYTIQAAKNSGIFDELMVSTDSKEYADISIEYGASVPFLRSKETASDGASTRDVIIEVINKYKESGKTFDFLMILQPTSPLRSSVSIIEALKTLKEQNANGVVSVCEVDHSPLWCNVLPKDKSLRNFLSNDGNHQRQQLETYYRINGAIYLYKTEYYLENEDAYNDNVYAYIMPREESIDIDSQLDFDIAEALMNR